MTGAKKSKAKTLAVLATATISTLLLVEIVLRWNDAFFEERTRLDWPSLHRVDENCGWALSSNVAATVETHYGDIPVRINSAGCRGGELGDVPEGRTRILCLGDSFIYDVAYTEETTYVGMTEFRLRHVGHDVELVNAGVIAYGTDQEYLYYKHRGHTLNASIVLLHVFIRNDLIDNNAKEFLELCRMPPPAKPYFTLEEGELTLNNWPYRGEIWPKFSVARDRQKLTRALGIELPLGLRTLELADRAFFQLGRKLELFPPDGLPPPRPAGPLGSAMDDPLTPPFLRGLELTKRLIVALNQEVQSRGATLGVVLIPAREQAEAPSPEELSSRTLVNRELSALCREHSLPVLDLAPVFHQVHGKSASLYDEIHWNVGGHAIASYAVSQWLAQSFSFR